MKNVFVLLFVFNVCSYGQDLKWFITFSDSADNSLGYYHTSKVDTQE